MTLLTVWADDQPATPILRTSDHGEIAQALQPLGVVFEHVPVGDRLPDSASQDEVLEAHRPLVDRLIAEHGYRLVDVAQLHPVDSDEWRATAAGARAKFLNEHTHDEEEIRYFVAGSGVFYLHIDGRVHAMLCTPGDLLSVPALTTHWFDMGTQPDFTAIRFFHDDDGWVGTFTGSDIATRFPTFDELALASA
ncbi:MAG: 1,2-dihydroxy-3-keto-5-methylthiopentene dioxygenase [Candidatus Nanopelagicales bacterium]